MGDSRRENGGSIAAGRQAVQGNGQTGGDGRQSKWNSAQDRKRIAGVAAGRSSALLRIHQPGSAERVEGHRDQSEQDGEPGCCFCWPGQQQERGARDATEDAGRRQRRGRQGGLYPGQDAGGEEAERWEAAGTVGRWSAGRRLRRRRFIRLPVGRPVFCRRWRRPGWEVVCQIVAPDAAAGEKSQQEIWNSRQSVDSAGQDGQLQLGRPSRRQGAPRRRRRFARML